MRRFLPASILVMALALLALPGAALAGPAKSAQARGFVALFAPDSTSPSFYFVYDSCFPARTIPVGTPVGSFINQPPSGCKVSLTNGYRRFELCVGRGTVPEPFRFRSRLVIEPGTSKACFPGARAARAGDGTNGTRVTGTEGTRVTSNP